MSISYYFSFLGTTMQQQTAPICVAGRDNSNFLKWHIENIDGILELHKFKNILMFNVYYSPVVLIASSLTATGWASFVTLVSIAFSSSFLMIFETANIFSNKWFVSFHRLNSTLALMAICSCYTNLQLPILRFQIVDACVWNAIDDWRTLDLAMLPYLIPRKRQEDHLIIMLDMQLYIDTNTNANAAIYVLCGFDGKRSYAKMFVRIQLNLHVVAYSNWPMHPVAPFRMDRLDRVR